jgi:two-component system cell cycle response regulator CpdR
MFGDRHCLVEEVPIQEVPMPHKPLALVVEDDPLQRAMVSILLEETEMDVFQCESGEDAQLILEKVGGGLCLMFTDVELAGTMTGADLANIAVERYPNVRVVVTSGNSVPALPAGTKFLQKPWNTLDVIREANEARPH